MLKDRRVVLGVTGGIAAYKACELVSRLKGDEKMSEALLELMEPVLKERDRKNIEQGISQGIAQGISQGIVQGAEEKQSDNVKKLAEYFMKENPETTIEQATEMAENILN